jgi:hypothetical protein
MQILQLPVARLCLALVLLGLVACQKDGAVAQTQPAAVAGPDGGSGQEAEGATATAAGGDLAPGQDADPDDGIADVPEPYAVGMAGPYHLWEDTEGGTVCTVDLADTPILGGYALTADQACVQGLVPGEDLHAWFVDPASEELVFIDATRKARIRLPHVQGLEYYLQAAPPRPYGLMLQPRDQ